MSANHHAQQAAEFDRLARTRVAEFFACERASHRRWLVREVARLRARADHHARRVAEPVSAAVQALADAALFYQRRARSWRSQAEREDALRRHRAALQQAAELETAAARCSQSAAGIINGGLPEGTPYTIEPRRDAESKTADCVVHSRPRESTSETETIRALSGVPSDK